MQVINTNVPSLNTQRRLTKSQSGLATSLERLSSGLRINSAKDDAAGMAIGARMTAQIRGQNQAYRNTNDGISLLNVAEGNLGTISDNTQRIRELAVQSSNGTYSPSDRVAMQAEVDQLMAASFAASDQANFNKIPLFDGTFSAGFQVGANRGDSVNVTLPKVMTKPAILTTPPTTVTTPEHTVTTPEHTVTTPDTTTSVPWYYGSTLVSSTLVSTALSAGDLVINGVPIPATVAGPGDGQTADSAWAIRNAISAAGVPNISVSSNTIVPPGNISAKVMGVNVASFEIIAAGAIVINGVPIGASSAADGMPSNTVYGLFDSFSKNIAAQGFLRGSTSSIWGGDESIGIVVGTDDGSDAILQETVPGSLAKLGLAVGTTKGQVYVQSPSVPSGIPIVISGNHPEYAGFTAGTTLPVSGAYGGVTVTVIPGTTTVIPESTVTVPETTVTTPGTTTIIPGDPGSDVLTQENAQKMIDWAEQKLQSVDGTRGYIGAMQNRFASIASNLSISSENLEASRSGIMDADYAHETAELAKNQILQQAGMAMLAQANNAPKNVLSLLPK